MHTLTTTQVIIGLLVTLSGVLGGFLSIFRKMSHIYDILLRGERIDKVTRHSVLDICDYLVEKTGANGKIAEARGYLRSVIIEDEK